MWPLWLLADSTCGCSVIWPTCMWLLFITWPTVHVAAQSSANSACSGSTVYHLPTVHEAALHRLTNSTFNSSVIWPPVDVAALHHLANRNVRPLSIIWPAYMWLLSTVAKKACNCSTSPGQQYLWPAIWPAVHVAALLHLASSTSDHSIIWPTVHEAALHHLAYVQYIWRLCQLASSECGCSTSSGQQYMQLFSCLANCGWSCSAIWRAVHVPTLQCTSSS
jgi:hypothetical protein